MPDVIGAIRQKWLALGGEAGYGAALDAERPTFDGVGRQQPFGTKGGIITWHPSIGAYEVHGLIAQKWIALGREKFGYPITDERTTPDQIGRYNHFRPKVPGFSDGSIYFHPRIGTHEVHGAIRAKWAELGWEAGKLSYPRTDEYPGFDENHRPDGSRKQEFHLGSVVWTQQGGVKVRLSVPID